MRLDHLPLAGEVKVPCLLLGLVQSLQVRGDVRCGKAHPVILENNKCLKEKPRHKCIDLCMTSITNNVLWYPSIFENLYVKWNCVSFEGKGFTKYSDLRMALQSSLFVLQSQLCLWNPLTNRKWAELAYLAAQLALALAHNLSKNNVMYSVLEITQKAWTHFSEIYFLLKYLWKNCCQFLLAIFEHL